MQRVMFLKLGTGTGSGVSKVIRVSGIAGVIGVKRWCR